MSQGGGDSARGERMRDRALEGEDPLVEGGRLEWINREKKEREERKNIKHKQITRVNPMSFKVISPLEGNFSEYFALVLMHFFFHFQCSDKYMEEFLVKEEM